MIYDTILSSVYFYLCYYLCFVLCVLIRTFTNPEYCSPLIVRINEILLYFQTAAAIRNAPSENPSTYFPYFSPRSGATKLGPGLHISRSETKESDIVKKHDIV
jgi:hypothetical protein